MSRFILEDGMDGQGFFTFLTQDDASVVSTWSEKSEKGGIFQGMALSVKEIWSLGLGVN